jgi:hypothetical protein
MGQGVLEGVFDITPRGSLVDELARLQNVELPINPLGGQLDNLTDQCEWEL